VRGAFSKGIANAVHGVADVTRGAQWALPLRDDGGPARVKPPSFGRHAHTSCFLRPYCPVCVGPLRRFLRLWLCPGCRRSSWGLGVVVGGTAFLGRPEPRRGCARAEEDLSFRTGEDSREFGSVLSSRAPPPSASRSSPGAVCSLIWLWYFASPSPGRFIE
jgi:hypothetical protein